MHNIMHMGSYNLSSFRLTLTDIRIRKSIETLRSFNADFFILFPIALAIGVFDVLWNRGHFEQCGH